MNKNNSLFKQAIKEQWCKICDYFEARQHGLSDSCGWCYLHNKLVEEDNHCSEYSFE